MVEVFLDFLFTVSPDSSSSISGGDDSEDTGFKVDAFFVFGRGAGELTVEEPIKESVAVSSEEGDVLFELFVGDDRVPLVRVTDGIIIK